MSTYERRPDPAQALQCGGLDQIVPQLRDPVGTQYQFERTGYFVSDTEDSRPGWLGRETRIGSQ
mgnify:CR=1 FL=1